MLNLFKLLYTSLLRYLKVVGVRLDLDAGDGVDLVIGGLQARRGSLIQTQCTGECRVSGIQDDGSIEILCEGD